MTRFFKDGIDVTPVKYTNKPIWEIESSKDVPIYEPVRKKEKVGLSDE
jgi:hypothetical protein